MYDFIADMYNRMDEVITVKASELRKDLFRLLDRCLEAGTAIDVPRKGRTVRIAALRRRIKVADLPRRPGVVVAGDELDRFSPAEWRDHPDAHARSDGSGE